VGEPAENKEALVQLDEVLTDIMSGDQIQLILVDDAHTLSADVVEKIYRFQCAHSDSLHLVFFSDIAGCWLKQLSEEIIPQVWTLEPYNQQQTLEYLKYRMETAGWQGKLPFSEEQVSAIYRKSAGCPGQINLLATVALQELMQEASARPASSRWPLYVGVSAGVAFLVVGLLYKPDNSAELSVSQDAISGGAVLRGDVQGNHSGNNQDSRTQTNKKLIPLDLPIGEAGEHVSGQTGHAAEVAQDKLSGLKTAAVPENEGRGEEFEVKVPDSPGKVILEKIPPMAQAQLLTDATDSKGAAREETLANPKAKLEQKSDHVDGAARQPKTLPSKAVSAKAGTTKPAQSQQLSAFSRQEQAILALPEEHFVIQLLGVSDRKRLDEYLSTLPKDISIRYYRRELNGKTLYVLITGEYASPEVAQRGISRLPARLRKQKPWVKQLKVVHKEIMSR
jgi:DamX protein